MKNFELETNEVMMQFIEFFSEDTVKGFLDLLCTKYLHQLCFDLWDEDPEQFIEVEDEILFARDQNI